MPHPLHTRCPHPCPHKQAKDSDLQRTQMMMKLKESRLARLQGGGERGRAAGSRLGAATNAATLA